MKITPPADDYGLQMLKQLDAHREVKPTGKVEATPRIESSDERHEPRAPMVSERRQQQRRKQGRRLLKYQTIIDTRDSHERRHALRREENGSVTTPSEESGSHGIDDFA
jgi:hypothetical protein